jgi:hypothetical protein
LRQDHDQASHLPEYAGSNAKSDTDLLNHKKDIQTADYKEYGNQLEGQRKQREEGHSWNGQVGSPYGNRHQPDFAVEDSSTVNDKDEVNPDEHSGVQGLVGRGTGVTRIPGEVILGADEVHPAVSEDHHVGDTEKSVGLATVSDHSEQHLLHTVNIPERHEPQRPEFEEYVRSPSRSRKHTFGQDVSVVRSTTNREGMHTDALHGSKYPTDSRSTNVETLSAVLSQDAVSHDGRRRGSRRQGRRASRKQRARLRAVSAALKATKDLSETSPGRESVSSFLEMELQNMRSRTQRGDSSRESAAKDWRERTSGGRRKSFDGGG